jgi:hypothetical protein
MFILFFSEKKAQLHQLEPSCLKKKLELAVVIKTFGQWIFG